MSKIRAELLAASKLTVNKGENEADFMRRMVVEITEKIPEADWKALSSGAQDWTNAAADAYTAKQEPPAFPDAEAAAAAPTRRRGAAATPVAAREPIVGDRVILTTKRGKVVEGIIVSLDGGNVVLNDKGTDGDEKDDQVFESWASIALSNTPEAAAAGPTTPVSEAATEPATPEEGDTLQVITGRDKTIMGVAIEIKGDDLVLKDSTGEEHELVISKLKSVEVKVKGKAAAPAPSRRGAAAAPAAAPAPSRRGAAKPAEEGKEPARTRSSNEKGASVSDRVAELMLDTPTMTEEQLEAALKKEKLEFKANTLSLNYTQAKRWIERLKARKLIK